MKPGRRDEQGKRRGGEDRMKKMRGKAMKEAKWERKEMLKETRRQ